jgi:hypothetical protein
MLIDQAFLLGRKAGKPELHMVDVDGHLHVLELRVLLQVGDLELLRRSPASPPGLAPRRQSAVEISANGMLRSELDWRL